MDTSEKRDEELKETTKRSLRKEVEGVVSSNKMDKTVVVAVTTQKRHPQYKKYIKRTKKYIAHDEQNTCQVGDRVRIIESRPLSKRKRWRLQSVVERAL